ncbi:M56 family metallopeptidase [Corallococcus sicarius]|uniref:M56 family metallopeptidase n=1 Tax=Corallococcus sicarius TaxID=2316726 RepID=A0A3A8MQ18_9BACT|nr:M56 family metallopeptidase [Corallococcus sicarius]RKH34126.1 M56 family metallopeptidase [Corallococcus sicarius]
MNGLILEAVGWALLHLMWQGVLVAAALALALRWVGGRSANLRYALACGALGIMLALPVATAWRHASRAVEDRPARTESFERSAPVFAGTAALTRTQPVHRPAIPSGVSEQPLWERAFQQVGEHLPWLVLAWGMGVAASSLRLLKGWMLLRHQVHEAVHASWEWQERMEKMARRLGLTRPVRLLVSSKLEVPSTLGWLKPVVLVPTATLTGLAVRELELVLAHELAHIRRHDFAVNVVQTLVETLLFYHPAVWWMSQVIRVERENCCDDLAVHQGSPLPYARALTALEALRIQGMGAGGPALSALGGSLKDRVRRLVLAPAPRCSSRWAAGISIFTLASSLALAVPLTALAVQPAKVSDVKAEPVAMPAQRDALPTPSSAAPTLPPMPGAGAAPSAPSSAAPALPSLPTRADAPSIAAPSLPALPVAGAAPALPPPPGLMIAAGPAPSVAPPLPPGPPKPPSIERPKAGRDDSDDADATTRVGQDRLTVDQLVELKIAGVTPEVVAKVTAMGYAPTVDTLVQFSHAGITPEYAKAMATRFGKPLPSELLVGMKHLGVTPEWLEQMKALGFKSSDPEELLSAKAVGIDAAWLNDLKSAGFGNLDLDTAVELRALGVDSGYLRELEAAGLKPANVDELRRLRTGGVDADFIRRMQQPRK